MRIPWRKTPDNFLLTRVHVWANTLHLVWTMSVLVVLLLTLVAYGIVHFRALELPMGMVVPYLVGVAFFAFACASPHAQRVHAQAAGLLVPGVLLESVGFSILGLLCFRPSQGTSVLLGACVLCSVATVQWWHHARRRELADWLDQSQTSGAYVIAIVCALLCLLLAGLITNAFV